VLLPFFQTDPLHKVDKDAMKAPIFMPGTQPSIETCENNNQALVTLGNFGGSYKRSDEAKSAAKKSQKPIYDEEGKQVFDTMYDGLPIDRQDIVTAFPEKFPNVSKAVWLYGFSPGYTSIGALPNGLGQLRVQSAGEVDVIAFPAASLVAAMKIETRQDVIKMDALPGFMKAIDGSALTNLVSNGGLKAYYIRQLAHSAIYIPPGYILCERLAKGVLVYGTRKTVVLRSSSAEDDYEALIGLISAADGDTTRWELARKVIAGED
jgi:hypothetical protein